MTQHAELIRRLETNAALMPSDAAVALEYKAAAEALKEQAAEIERLSKDAGRYAFLRKCHWTDSPPTYVVTTLEGLKLNAMTYSDDRLDEVLDARVAANSTATQKGQP